MNTLLAQEEREECCIDCLFTEVCELDSKVECQRMCIDTSPDYDYNLFDESVTVFNWRNMYEKRTGLTQRLLDEEVVKEDDVTLIELKTYIYE